MEERRHFLQFILTMNSNARGLKIIQNFLIILLTYGIYDGNILF